MSDKRPPYLNRTIIHAPTLEECQRRHRQLPGVYQEWTAITFDALMATGERPEQRQVIYAIGDECLVGHNKVTFLPWSFISNNIHDEIVDLRDSSGWKWGSREHDITSIDFLNA